ncbi:hypothetical protein [Candidatus Spongiisocius sp.]|uniref:hypothetical protein n=1 Tax=Candidatus Spongiisocius sp. TaxID=3101273 RepID=UPI003B5A5433
MRPPGDQTDALEMVAQANGVGMSQAVRGAIESRQADDGFEERLTESMARSQRILDRLAE